MFSKIKTNFSLLFCLVLLTTSFAYGQTQENRDAEYLMNSVTEKAGANFKEGLIALKDNLRPFALEKFDKAIEVFLMSTLNVQRNPKLQNCYNQLVETVYLIEFPSNQKPPQIKTLSATCGWNINDQLANDIAKLVLTNPINAAVASNTSANSLEKTQGGFVEQKYEPSPLDELAKLELTQEEEVSLKPAVTNPVRKVRAKDGDTVTSLAARERVSAREVAQLNGLLPSTKLSAGREIKIPNDVPISKTSSLNTKCSLTLRSAPALRGLKLGMTPIEISKALDLAVITKPKKSEISLKKNGENYVEISFFDKEYEKNKREFDLGEETFFYVNRNNSASSKLDGINYLSLAFYKKSLYLVYISYDSKDIKWENLKEFISNVSDKLNLPFNSWRIEGNYAHLSCGDFSMYAIFGTAGITLSLTNNSTRDEIESTTNSDLSSSTRKKILLTMKKRRFLNLRQC